MSASKREEVTEAAVMQTVTENRAIRAYFENHPTGGPGGSGVSLREIRASKEYQSEVARLEKAAKSGDSKAQEQYDDVRADTQILDSYLEQHKDTNPVVLDYQHDSKNNWGVSALIGTDDSYTVAYSGTDQGEGIDNGEGMYEQSTFNQRAAAEYYDDCYEAYGDFDDKQVTVVGHSKGGNKAMYTTMSASNADSIDSCVALDGQGFSQEFIDSWDGNETTYNERRAKITLVVGENDYVHALGNPIALDENTYYLDYNGPVDMMKYHKHQYLFAHEGEGAWVCDSDTSERDRATFDTPPGAPDTDRLDLPKYHYEAGEDSWTATLEAETSPGMIPQMIRDFMDFYMTLPDDIKRKTAPGLMELIWSGQSADGVDPNTFMTLLYTFMVSVALLVKDVMGNKAVAKLFEITVELGKLYNQVKINKASEEAAAHPEFYLDPVMLGEGSSFNGNAKVCFSLKDIMNDLDGAISRTAIPREPLSLNSASPHDAVDPVELGEIVRLDKEIAETKKRIGELNTKMSKMVGMLEQVQYALRGAIDYMANTAILFEACESNARSLAEDWRGNPFDRG